METRAAAEGFTASPPSDRLPPTSTARRTASAEWHASGPDAAGGFRTAPLYPDWFPPRPRRRGPACTLLRATIPTRSLPCWGSAPPRSPRSEEHTSELQSLTNLVCRLLLEKKKN